MLPRLHRLTSPADFRRVMRSGRKIVRPRAIVHFLPPTTGAHEDSPARVGVTVSKAVGGSVTRHRAARIIRHSIAQELGSLPQGSSWVVRALPAAGKVSASRELAEDIRSAVQEAIAE